jgi:hypothetical protein
MMEIASSDQRERGKKAILADSDKKAGAMAVDRRKNGGF